MKRSELERHARKLYTGCPGCAEEACDYCMAFAGDDTVPQLMEFIDQYVDTILADLANPYEEMWTAEQVADFLDLSDENSARATMSRRKISSVKKTSPITGRTVAYYPADAVRAIREAREAVRQ